MDTGEIIVKNEEMIEFFEKFDSIQLKYNLDSKSKSYIYLYEALENIESAYQFSELTKSNYDLIGKNLDLIYDSKKASDQITKIYDIVKNNIINQYICIDGLERLFSDKYIEFEWNMHLGIDYKKHQMEFYRDHFVHQMRNLYCLHMMLSDEKVGGFSGKKGLGFIHLVKRILEVPSNSKVSRYTYKMVEQQKHYRYFPNYKIKLRDGNILYINKKYNTDEFYYRNIIFMAGYMAALFHDIGYPEVSNVQNQRRITEYIANLYNAESSGYDYPRLNSLLQNSFLFRVVSFTEIRNRMSGEKPDHGAFSAIIFLLNFYENGAIHGLEPYKRCAVELAAFAIYNHTNKYSYSKKAEENGYIHNSFLLNPISYLLRICDDLQEWNRIYFELSKNSNLIVCGQCKTPVIRKTEKEKVFYMCNCNLYKAEKAVFSSVFNYTENFPYRRIYNITVCDRLIIGYDEIEDTKKFVKFKLDYKLDRLLHMAYINPDYAKYRIKELNQLKELFNCQPELPPLYLQYFITANPVLIKVQILNAYLEEYDKNFIDMNFSSVVDRCRNCIDKLSKLLKKKNDEIHKVQNYTILEEIKMERFKTIEKKYNNDKEELIIKMFQDITPLLKNWQASMENLFYPLINNAYNKGKRFTLIIEMVKKSIRLYIELLLVMKISIKLNENGLDNNLFLLLFDIEQEREKEEEEKVISDKEILELIKPEYNTELRGLVKDSIKQFTKIYEKIENLKQRPVNYYTQFDTEDYIYGCIKRFVNTEQYVPVYQRKKEAEIRKDDSGIIYIDAYTDLAFFQILLRDI